jgi:hypothetical protein
VYLPGAQLAEFTVMFSDIEWLPGEDSFLVTVMYSWRSNRDHKDGIYLNTIHGDTITEKAHLLD